MKFLLVNKKKKKNKKKFIRYSLKIKKNVRLHKHNF